MLKGKYRAFEIQDDKVKETLVEGNLPAMQTVSGDVKKTALS